MRLQSKIGKRGAGQRRGGDFDWLWRTIEKSVGGAGFDGSDFDTVAPAWKQLLNAFDTKRGGKRGTCPVALSKELKALEKRVDVLETMSTSEDGEEHDSDDHDDHTDTVPENHQETRAETVKEDPVSKPTSSTPAPTGTKPKYVGCYADGRRRDFKHGPRRYGYNLATCQAACKDYRYFALQDNGWCSCDNDYGTPASRHQKRPDRECGSPCVGETSAATRKYCGSSWRNAVYDGKPKLRKIERNKFTVGQKVNSQWSNGKWYGATVSNVNGDGTFALNWDDGYKSETVHASNIEAVVDAKPSESTTKKSSSTTPTSTPTWSKQADWDCTSGSCRRLSNFRVRMKQKGAYCNNYIFTETVARNDARSCARKVLGDSKCSRKWFDYNPVDGSRYCVRAGDECTHHGKARWNIYSIDHTYKRGERIEVAVTFQADGKMKTRLRKGLRGRIDEIDHEGDALINFDALDTRQWIKKQNFHKIRVIA